MLKWRSCCVACLQRGGPNIQHVVDLDIEERTRPRTDPIMRRLLDDGCLQCRASPCFILNATSRFNLQCISDQPTPRSGTILEIRNTWSILTINYLLFIYMSIPRPQLGKASVMLALFSSKRCWANLFLVLFCKKGKQIF